jgi:hypothetical protein
MMRSTGFAAGQGFVTEVSMTLGRDADIGPGGAVSGTPPRSWHTGVAVLDAVLAEATGHGHRRDPVHPRTGGPAGNARLTSWVGLVLLVLIVAELVTLLDVTGLIGWHVGVGIALTAFTLVKSASTTWRMLRYYTGSRSYGVAGPPPLLLRGLGPLVIVTTLGVLGSGLALIAVGPAAGRESFLSVLGQQLSALRVHQGFFVLFAVAVGLHLLARLVPAVTMTIVPRRRAGPPRPVPGGVLRLVIVVASALASIVAIVLVVPSVHGWQAFHHDGPRPVRDLGR